MVNIGSKLVPNLGAKLIDSRTGNILPPWNSFFQQLVESVSNSTIPSTSNIPNGYVLTISSNGITWSAPLNINSIKVSFNDLTNVPSSISALKSLVVNNDKIAYYTGINTASLTTITSAARNLLDDSNATEQRTTLEIPTGIQLQNEVYNNRRFIMLSWQGANDSLGRFFTSFDGYKWSFASNGNIPFYAEESSAIEGLFVHDSGLNYIDGVWYIPFSTVASNHDFKVYVGTSLSDLKLKLCKIGTGIYSTTISTVGGTVPTDAVWAPKFFKYLGDLYVIVSVPWAANQTDSFGNSVRYMRPYVAKCNDIDALTFNSGSFITGLSYTDSKIDSNPQIVDSEWWFTLKNDITGNTEIYKTTNPLNLTSITPQIISWTSLANKGEGQSVTVSEMANGISEIKLFADLHNTGYYASVSSFDGGSTWSSPIKLDFPMCVRHGNVLDLMSLNEPDRSTSLASWDRFQSTTGIYTIPFQNAVNLGNGSVNLVPLEDQIYYVSGSNSVNLTIVEICAHRFWLLAATGISTAGINVINNSLFPSGLSIGYGVNYDILIEIRLNRQFNQYYATGSVIRAVSGWSRATGTASRSTFDTSSATTKDVAERLKALIDDLLTLKIIKI